MKNLIIVTSALLTIAGCATTKFDAATWNIEVYSYKTVGQPPLNKQTIINVGESIVSSNYVTKMSVIEIQDDDMPTTIYRGRMKIGFLIPRGIYEKSGTDGNGGEFFSSKKLIEEYYGEDGSMKKWWCREGGIHIDKYGKKRVFWFPDESDYVSMFEAPQIKYTRIEKNHSLSPSFLRLLKQTYSERTYQNLIQTYITTDDVKRSLVYTGSSKDSIFVKYERYLSSQDIPNYYLNLTYDGAKGKIIGYQGARFEVIDTTNTTITYKVISHLSPLETSFTPHLRTNYKDGSCN